MEKNFRRNYARFKREREAMSRELPILFNTDMVRAILREVNPKTATRRAIKGYIPDDAVFGYTASTPEGYISCRGTFEEGYGEKFFKLPCQKGDILYVRETWAQSTDLFGEFPEYIYRADHTALGGTIWHPSIHMPKEAARIWLKVTDVRVEKLHDITEEQAEAEGLYKGWKLTKTSSFASTAKQAFMWIWDMTIKAKQFSLYGWPANPWVWVIEFERCEKPEH